MKKIFLIAGAVFSIYSCSRLDDNMSPNAVPDGNVPARQKLAAAETSTFDAQTGDLIELSNFWMNTTAGNNYQWANVYPNESSLNLNSAFRNQLWNNTYLSVANLQAIIDGSSAKSLPLHVAIAKILKANYLHYIVDFYSDAPYFDAFKQQSNLAPKYDKGEAIYMDLIKGINEAIDAIDNTPVNNDNQVKASEDVIFGGTAQIAKWRQFANSIKLRMLLRMSNATDGTVKSFVTSELVKLNSDKVPFATRFVTYNVTINPGYNAGSNQGLNPFFRRYGAVDVSGTDNDTYTQIRVSEHYAKLINGDASKPTVGIVDPRGVKQFIAIDGELVGTPQGNGKIAGASQDDFSALGGNLNRSASNALGGLDNGYLMLASEGNFLLAEAAIVYPQYFSNGKTYFEQGIRDSFTFWGLTSAQAATYITAINGNTHLGWDAAGNKLEPLQYQRLFALANYRPMETYLNYIKTGFPETPLASNAQQPRKPYRLIYPVSEYTGNSSNVPNISAADCFTKNQTTPFWLR